MHVSGIISCNQQSSPTCTSAAGSVMFVNSQKVCNLSRRCIHNDHHTITMSMTPKDKSTLYTLLLLAAGPATTNCFHCHGCNHHHHSSVCRHHHSVIHGWSIITCCMARCCHHHHHHHTSITEYYWYHAPALIAITDQRQGRRQGRPQGVSDDEPPGGGGPPQAINQSNKH